MCTSRGAGKCKHVQILNTQKTGAYVCIGTEVCPERGKHPRSASPFAGPSPNPKSQMFMQHSDETKAKFFELRAVGIPYARIASELKVAKCTLIDWARKYKARIDNLRAIELEAAQERFLGSREKQIETLGARLRALEQELDKRKPEYMTYQELNQLIRETRSRLDKLCIEPAFVDDAEDAGRDAAPSASEAPSAQ